MNDLSSGLVTFFSQDHRHCDALWAEVEATNERGKADETRAAWQAFEQATRAHFAMEEEVLFPAFEEASGMRGGPTEMMRIEHRQMRALLDQMGASAAKSDFDEVLDHGDTLLMLIQQHNSKEEHVLYPMAEQHLAANWPEIANRLKGMAASES